MAIDCGSKASRTRLENPHRREQELISEQYNVTALLQQLASSKVTSTELVSAFCKRAIFFNDAIARAKELDKHLQQTRKVVGPLHGLPITFKDSFHIKGHDVSIGITQLCFSLSPQNSLLYDILTKYGVIVIAKTIDFTVAGSTGGEAALLTLGRITLGISTNRAGSVQMPATMKRVVRYKPSRYYLLLNRRRILGAGIIGTTILGPVIITGFLGCSVYGMTLAAKLASEARPWEKDPFIYSYPWQGLRLPTAQQLQIGVWLVNNFLHLHPPSAGDELVDFKAPDISDDLSYLRKLLSKEPSTEIVKVTKIITKKAALPPTTIEYLYTMNSWISALVCQMHAAWSQNSKSINTLLWVPAPYIAVPYNKYTYLRFTGMFNIIDWPAMTLLLDLYADKDIDKMTLTTLFNVLDAEIQDLYNPDSFNRLPLAIQLIGR
ncbi:amidase signature domain-containing protein [Aspergillus spectabilis]